MSLADACFDFFHSQQDIDKSVAGLREALDVYDGDNDWLDGETPALRRRIDGYRDAPGNRTLHRLLSLAEAIYRARDHDGFDLQNAGLDKIARRLIARTLMGADDVAH